MKRLLAMCRMLPFLVVTASSIWAQVAPAPTITALVPSSASAGSWGIFLEVQGTGFYQIAGTAVVTPTVTFRGQTYFASFISSTQLFVSIPQTDLEQSGTAQVFVTNPDAQVSNTVSFILRPPAITSLTPSLRAVGTGAFLLTLDGTDFVDHAPVCDCGSPQHSQIIFDGTPLTTTFVSATRLTATVPGPLAGPPRTVNVTVRNPQVSPATGALSAAASFQIVAAPTVSSVSPVSRTQNTLGNTTITLTGANFLTGDLVYWDGPTTQLATVVVDPTHVTATLPESLVTIYGAHTVGIWRASDGYTSNSVPFVVNGVPAISLLTPADRTASPTGITLTVSGVGNGSGFIPNQVVEWTPSGGSPTILTTTYVDPGTLTASVPGTLLANPGTATVRVRTIDNVYSNALTFTIYPAPAITSLAPDTVAAGHSAFTLTVNGTNIRAGAVIQWNGTDLTTTSPSAGVLQANIAAGLVTSAGSVPITIRTADNVVSAPTSFRVVAPPAITSLNPSSRTAGSAAFTLTVNGTNFGNGSLVQWNGSNLATTFVSATQLTANVTAPLVASPGSANVTVAPADGTASAPAKFDIVPAPTLTSLNPTSAVAGGAAFSLVLTGTNCTNTMTAVWAGTPLTTTFNSATQLTAAVPASLITTAGTANVRVVTTDGVSTTGQVFTIHARLVISTTVLPQGEAGLSGYTAQLSGAGGVAPYHWSASGLPAGLAVNSTTGLITGTPRDPGTFTIAVVLTDTSGQTANAGVTLEIRAAVIPLDITTPSVPRGIVDTPYTTGFAATGGRPGYTFSIGGGTIPPGLSLTPQGILSGTPTTRGTYRLIVRVTDALGAAANRTYDIVIAPQPLTVTGSPSEATVGSPVSVPFGATGGVPPYRFGVSGSIPSGTTFANGLLSGTAVAAGVFEFSVAATDSDGTVATRTFTLTVKPATLTLTGTAGNGQVGAAYSAQFGATGGAPPYTFSATGLPAGVSLNGSSLSGTPTADGTFNLSVTVTDSAKATATGSFTVVIAPLTLVITTAALPEGAVNATYNASLAATGGVPPLTWSIGAAPDGLTGSTGGALNGTPGLAGFFTIVATVTDSKGNTASKSFPLTIAAPPLVITTAALPGATAGAAYSAAVAATGGVPPYTWSAAGLPAGVSFSNGSFSGSFAQPGTINLPVTVTDSAGSTTTRSYTVAIGLPTTPPVNIGGAGDSNPGTQPQFQIGLGSPYPGTVNVTLTLTFAPDSGPDDPAVQFQGGGRTVQVTIPEGSTVTPNVGIQAGTVSGVVTITARLTAFSSDVTPTPVPTRTIRINPLPPVISSVTAVRNSTGFTVTIAGFASSRELTQALFTFAPAAGANLQTTQITAPVDAIFTQWWNSAASAPFGSQFILTWTFTVQGSSQSIASVTVTLANRLGNSNAVTANLQ